MPKKKCRPSQHTDQPMRATARVKCTACGDEYPCAHACGHLDCRAERGEPMPDWATYVVEAPVAAAGSEAIRDLLDSGAVVVLS